MKTIINNAFPFLLLPQQIIYQKSNCPMNKNPSVPHHNTENLSKHQCCQCIQNEAILAKYEKLVDLLYKKIKQLQKKSKIETQTLASQQQHHLSAKKSQRSPSLGTVQDKVVKSIDDASTLHSQAQPWIDQLPLTISKSQSAKVQRSQGCEPTEIQRLEKVSIVINGLTEQVMQLKSNLMHIRYCIYAVFKQLNIGEKISSNHIALHIILTLIGIFQFSQNQKEEMFNHKKVKLRKKQKGENKENIFVTIKEI